MMPARSFTFPMRTKSGAEISTSLDMTEKVRWTRRSKTCQPRLGAPNSTPRAIRVNDVGKPRKIVATRC
jgi:hypothetical protein